MPYKRGATIFSCFLLGTLVVRNMLCFITHSYIAFWIDSLIDWCLKPTAAVVQLYNEVYNIHLYILNINCKRTFFNIKYVILVFWLNKPAQIVLIDVFKREIKLVNNSTR